MGPIGNLHARIYRSLPNVKLVGVCDILQDRAEAAGRTHGVPYYLDAQQMLDELKPDLCSVATGGYEYSSDHYKPSMQVLAAGCHLLCEKPISNDIGHAREMVALAKKNNLCFGIDFNHRFTPASFEAKKWQNEGRIGDLLFCNMALWIGKPGEFESPYYHLKALNPHSVDMMRHFMGDVEAVQCFAMKAPGRNIWSTASINMKFKNGAVGHLTSSYDLHRGHPMERCEVAGTKGRMVICDMWKSATLFLADDMTRLHYENPVFGGYSNFDDTFACRIKSFVDQVESGVSPDEIDGSGEAGLEASRVIHAAILSLQEERIVRIEEI
jgi:predicted dehydrogenase